MSHRGSDTLFTGSDKRPLFMSPSHGSPSHGSVLLAQPFPVVAMDIDHTIDRSPQGFDGCGSDSRASTPLGVAMRPFEYQDRNGLAEQCLVRPAWDFFDKPRYGIAGQHGSQLANDGFT
jgi:hypothetical protein